ncbi:dihydroneopterin aldolase [Roseobacter sp. N2S]|uniref:dihydroneopterin aldolase n=1 Tax=Roseobacter sp. N2S TaxID=2663844 RepID=UPI0028555F92|nr:dihydroneopterin aldolase [Roseobacter sp. N2S]MDR6266235.1 dihydroneopterin aldolase [Roseobacter sp. N2S]
MTDETSLAFEAPEARAIATAETGAGAAPLDRISVRDYTTSVEIGAFQAERDVEQRIRFNVVLEVARHGAADTDDVDQVLSYDTIIEAIQFELAAERLNLLETLAERIAERILGHAKAVRVFVRIEKLDRIPGTLGIEIVRSRSDAGANVDALVARPLVVFIPNPVLASSELPDWLDAIAGHDQPALICLQEVARAVADTGNAKVDRRLGLLSIEQNAWVLSGVDKRCVVVGSRTELDWAMKNGQLSVWAPSKMVLDAVNAPIADSRDPLALAQWIAQEFGADHLTVAGGFDGGMVDATCVVVQTPNAL